MQKRKSRISDFNIGDYMRLTVRKQNYQRDGIVSLPKITEVEYYCIVIKKSRDRLIVDSDDDYLPQLKVADKWVSTVHNDKPGITDFDIEKITRSEYLVNII